MDHEENNTKILVVDDEDRNLRLMKAMLIPLGYQVYFARDGKESLDKVKELSPDLILLDVMMPKLDGFEVTKRLKSSKETDGIPIVMVTTLSDIEDKVKALDLGADDFLSKPVEKIELRARVQSLLKVKAYNDHMRDYRTQLEKEVSLKTNQLQKAIVQVKDASLDTIFRLSRAAECKDEETGDHIQRVSRLAVALAKKMDLAPDVAVKIQYAAPLHDIGKIGIPEKILLKPGKLDDDEWEIMKLHTILGGRILEGSQADHLQVGEIIALTHHERWDGQGYPRGLKADQIPIEGQITAIVDVFDALTSKRPYREPMSLEKAFGIIREGRGAHFNPDLVDAFFAIEDEIVAIKEKLQDKNPSLMVKLFSNIKPDLLTEVQKDYLKSV